jgi:hypothetical protein
VCGACAARMHAEHARVQGVFSTIQAQILWGLEEGGVDNTPNVEGDPVGLPQTTLLKFAPQFDLSKPEWQLLVNRQLEDLFEPQGGAGTKPNATSSVRRLSMPHLRCCRSPATAPQLCSLSLATSRACSTRPR